MHERRRVRSLPIHRPSEVHCVQGQECRLVLRVRPKMNQDNWRLIRASRVNFTAGNVNAEQTKDINHYLALMHETKQRVEWKQARDGDLAHLARVCR